MKLTFPTIGTMTMAVLTSLSANANPADPARVAQALNPLVDNNLEVRDGKLIVKESDYQSDQIRKVVEDCRQLAINSAIVDVNMAGESIREISSKFSHRVQLSVLKEEVLAHVAVRLTSADGKDFERTYLYLMKDPGDKYCYFEKSAGQSNTLRARKDVEKEYLEKIIPSLSKEDLDALKANDGAPVTTNEEVAKEAVSKLIKDECTQTAINTALLKSSELFKKTTGTKAIQMINFKKSQFKKSSADKKAMSAIVRIAMTDGQGTRTMSTNTHLELKEKDNDCMIMKQQTIEKR